MFVVGLLVLARLLWCSAEESIQSNATAALPEEEEIVLDGLTDAELEAICTDRGFELVRETDDDGGQVVYSHEDYVDAAKQCLAIEAEMEKVLEENPDIIEELQAEAARMTAEKEKLEAKLAAAKDKIAAQQEEEKPAFVEQKRLEKEEHAEEILSQEHTSANDEETVEDDGEGISTETANTAVDETSEDIIDLDLLEEEKERVHDNETYTKPEDIGSGKNVTEESKEQSVPNVVDGTMTDAVGEHLDLKLVSVLREALSKFRKDFDKALSILLRGLGPFLLVAKETGATVVDMVKRYIRASLNPGNQGSEAESEVDLISVPSNS